MSNAAQPSRGNGAKDPDAVDHILIALVMGLSGAFLWAIRGTGGYGGADGGLLAGLGWAMLWLGFSRFAGRPENRPYGSGRMVAAIVFGIAFGGFTGYGVYTAWVCGRFYLAYPEGLRPVGAWTGYAMLFLCGIHWGGVAGAFMAWCAPKKPLKWYGWVARIASGVAGAILAHLIVKWLPQFFLPFYDEGLYQVAENKTCVRALHSLPNVMQHVGLFAGFVAFEAARRDWRAVKLMLVMALGFAIPFAVGGYWHTMRDSSLAIGWWKNWEMTIGLGGGLAFGLAFYLFNRPEPDTRPRPVTRLERIFGIGLPMWLAVTIVIRGGYEGFTRVRGLEELKSTVGPVFWVAFAAAGVAYIAWIVRTLMLDKKDLAAPGSAPMSMRVLLGVLGLIVVAGYVASVPVELKLANKVLLSLYTLYIGGSVALFAWLWTRRGRA